MDPRIVALKPKKLVGKRLRMSHASNRTGQLFGSFMSRRREIVNAVSNNIFCVGIYGNSYSFENFDPSAEFEKWAAVEVRDSLEVPGGMENLELPGGLYAVFDHKGGPAAAPRTFGYIFGTWLPNSAYLLDNRPHFEILGERYGGGGPDSEEEIWVPILPK
jgi:AraC family transcriptional regulator